jgi:hypothetical protein
VQHILLITETSDLAADLLVLAAKARGVPLIRFNQDEFPRRVRISWRNRGQTLFCLDPETCVADSDIAGAWFRRPLRPAVHGDAAAAFVERESAGFLNGVWDTAPWLWMNSPADAARAEHKLLQLREAERLGFAVPDTVATNCPDEARGFVLGRAAIAKTLVGGRLSVDGMHQAVFTTAVGPRDLDADAAIRACPAIFQSRIATLRDLRVTVVGNQVFAAQIMLRDRTDDDVDWRGVDPVRVRYDRYRLPAGLQAKCVDLVAALGLTYGALDFVVTPQGEHVFLELNPAGQWGWLERRLGLPITDAILDTLMGGVS